MTMRKATDCFKLGNGYAIPCLGFGTWQTPDGDVAVAAVKAALQKGYRHIDAAAVYGNETGVAKASSHPGCPGRMFSSPARSGTISAAMKILCTPLRKRWPPFASTISIFTLFTGQPPLHAFQTGKASTSKHGAL